MGKPKESVGSGRIGLPGIQTEKLAASQEAVGFFDDFARTWAQYIPTLGTSVNRGHFEMVSDLFVKCARPRGDKGKQWAFFTPTANGGWLALSTADVAKLLGIERSRAVLQRLIKLCTVIFRDYFDRKESLTREALVGHLAELAKDARGYGGLTVNAIYSAAKAHPRWGKALEPEERALEKISAPFYNRLVRSIDCMLLSGEEIALRATAEKGGLQKGDVGAMLLTKAQVQGLITHAEQAVGRADASLLCADQEQLVAQVKAIAHKARVKVKPETGAEDQDEISKALDEIARLEIDDAELVVEPAGATA